jgi:hypothetical protein
MSPIISPFPIHLATEHLDLESVDPSNVANGSTVHIPFPSPQINVPLPMLNVPQPFLKKLSSIWRQINI